MHGYRNELHFCVKEVTCLCCNVVFHCRQRVFRHLNRKGGVNNCARFYRENITPMTADELMQVEAVQKSAKPAVKEFLAPALPKARFEALKELREGR